MPLGSNPQCPHQEHVFLVSLGPTSDAIKQLRPKLRPRILPGPLAGLSHSAH